MENLYFIALIPQKDLCDKVRAIQQDMAIRYFSKRSLRVIPHITLKSPFIIQAEYHDLLIRWFSGLEIQTNAFDLELQNYGFFENEKHPVIYIRPVDHPALMALQQQIVQQIPSIFLADVVSTSDKKFIPHMTVAYRDLTPQNFRIAYPEFLNKRFSADLRVEDFHLMQHDGEKWNPIMSNELKKNVYVNAKGQVMK